MKGRTIIDTANAAFEPYDLEGPRQPEMSFLPLSYDRASGEGAYLMRMEPGAHTLTHTHERREEFLILDGELIEDDGTVYRAGDYVIMEPGTRHDSRTETGCVLIGIDWQRSTRGGETGDG